MVSLVLLSMFAGIGLWWTRGRVAGALGVVGAAYFGVLDVWEQGLSTLALMGVAVVCTVWSECRSEYGVRGVIVCSA